MQAIDVRDRELERRLEQYARARLSPDSAVGARARARIMREFRLSTDAARIAAHVGPTLVVRRSVGRRLLMPLLAAAVWLGIAVGSIAAAQPGGPLYLTRLWIENATLPSSPSGRIESELSRLDERLAEAMSAASRGDRSAVAAALDAYAAIADDALEGSNGNADLLALVESALAKHQAVLAAVAARLEDRGNTTAADAIERNIQRTIDRNAATIERIGPPSPARGGGTSTGSGSGSGAGGNPTSGEGTPTTPTATPKPQKTPPAHPTPSLDPGHSPRSQK